MKLYRVVVNSAKYSSLFGSLPSQKEHGPYTIAIFSDIIYIPDIDLYSNYQASSYVDADMFMKEIKKIREKIGMDIPEVRCCCKGKLLLHIYNKTVWKKPLLKNIRDKLRNHKLTLEFVNPNLDIKSFELFSECDQIYEDNITSRKVLENVFNGVYFYNIPPIGRYLKLVVRDDLIKSRKYPGEDNFLLGFSF